MVFRIRFEWMTTRTAWNAMLIMLQEIIFILQLRWGVIRATAS